MKIIREGRTSYLIQLDNGARYYSYLSLLTILTNTCKTKKEFFFKLLMADYFYHMEDNMWHNFWQNCIKIKAKK